MQTTTVSVRLNGERNMEDRAKIDREFWAAWLALSRTLAALREAVKECQGAGLVKVEDPPRGGVG